MRSHVTYFGLQLHTLNFGNSHLLMNFTGAYLNVIKRTVMFLCPADIIPPYIEVDLSELDVGQVVKGKDLKVHPALKLLRPAEEPVIKIMGTRVEPQKKSK
uniref:Large ribosomal subunit protein bL25 beta domain-containing protein n=1 Tax=Kalanchoe fedtschenkoi TaxID=63787 RepID=A0A7N0TTP8_KALFE